MLCPRNLQGTRKKRTIKWFSACGLYPPGTSWTISKSFWTMKNNQGKRCLSLCFNLMGRNSLSIRKIAPLEAYWKKIKDIIQDWRWSRKVHEPTWRAGTSFIHTAFWIMCVSAAWSMKLWWIYIASQQHFAVLTSPASMPVSLKLVQWFHHFSSPTLSELLSFLWVKELCFHLRSRNIIEIFLSTL